MQVLDGLPEPTSERLVVGGGPDDGGVYRMDDGNVMIQSVDFFTPIVDDPDAFGRIAAANSMSDIYAMGAHPRTALNVTGVPLEDVGLQRLQTILRSSHEKVEQAGAVVVGGHTVKSPEPFFGLAVTGFSAEDRLIQNDYAEVDDRLILTKPLGTGILTTAHKNGDIPHEEWLEEGIQWMSRLNEVGATLAERGLISSMTDITGYGFLGHGFEMLGEDHGMEIEYDQLPILPGIPDLIADGNVPGGTRTNWSSVEDKVQIEGETEPACWLLADAQTSGGLLLSVPETNRNDVSDLLRSKDLCSDVVGRVTDQPGAVIHR